MGRAGYPLPTLCRAACAPADARAETAFQMWRSLQMQSEGNTIAWPRDCQDGRATDWRAGRVAGGKAGQQFAAEDLLAPV